MARRVLRRSQLIGTFGPGAIVDLPQESVMVAGTDQWPEGDEIHEPRLERALRVRRFQAPRATGDDHAQDIPVIRFPQQVICPKCNRLEAVDRLQGLYPQRGELKCPSCKVPVYPSRFLIACEAGHVDDFPWYWWAHEGRACSQPRLKVYSLGATSALSDIRVECESCGKRRSLHGVFGADALKGYACPGTRPWLAVEPEPCERRPRVLQRGASNVYFPVTASALSIPEWSNRIHSLLSKHWNVLTAVPDEALEVTIRNLQITGVYNLKVADIVSAIRRRKQYLGEQGISLEELRLEEAEALSRGSTDAGGEFECRPSEVHPSIRGLVSKVMLVTRLREVRALRGFTRISPPDPHLEATASLAPLSATPLPWLPAVEIRGEGIYFELAEDTLQAWEEDHRIRARVSALNERYHHLVRSRNQKAGRDVSPRYILLHTLAHLFINQLALDCGYSQASLRERIYALTPGEAREPNMRPVAGILIYTGTPDSDGSLGGLVRQGETRRFYDLLRDTIRSSRWCSSDPLCLESSAQGVEGLNLAACHACCLLPETSCETANRFLDRALLIGYLSEGITGLFEGLE